MYVYIFMFVGRVDPILFFLFSLHFSQVIYIITTQTTQPISIFFSHYIYQYSSAAK